MHNSKEWAPQNYIGSINLDNLTFDDVPDLAPSPIADTTASPKALSCNNGPKGGGIGKANRRRRSRASSKKAPTTLLKADANNFRALVQKFTGLHSETPLLRPYKGPINLNFEQCSYYPKNVEQNKKPEQVDCKRRLLEETLDHRSVCRNVDNKFEMGTAAAIADLDQELFDQNPRDDHGALTYEGLDMDKFLGTADYSTILSETMDDEFWGYRD